MEKCPVCGEQTKGKYWCGSCKTVFVCPAPNCGFSIKKPGAEECPRCGLLFADYMEKRKMYKRCSKCKKKQGLAEMQCRYCRHWFNCPVCGHRITSTSAFSCPHCGNNLFK